MDSLGDFLIWTIEVFFLMLAIWIFIALFSDIFRRTDLSGGAKAGWTLLLFVLPFIGALIYLIARPKVTPGDVQMLARSEAAQKAVAGVSPADEIAKLQQLKEAGVINQMEYESLKAKTVGA